MRKIFDCQQESEICAEYISGKSAIQIAVARNVHRTTIYDALERSGVRRRTLKESNSENIRRLAALQRRFDGEESDLVVELYQDGMSTIKIAAQLQCHPSTVADELIRRNIPRRSYSDARREYALNQHAFDNISNSETGAYFVGLIMADGCIKKTTYSWQLSISLSNEDGEHLNELRKFLRTNIPLYYAHSRMNSWGLSGPSKRLTISSTIVANALMQYGITERKSMSCRVNGLEANRHFWRGVICGDGEVSIVTDERGFQRPKIGLVGSKPLLAQFADFVRDFTDCQATVSRMHSIWRFETKGRFAKQIIHRLFDGATVALPRKANTAKIILSEFRDDGRHISTQTKPDYSWMTPEMINIARSKFSTWEQTAAYLQIPPPSLCVVRKRLGMY